MTDDRQLYIRAVREVLDHRRPSASFLQRRLGIGYAAAAGLVEKMEAEGIVGAPDHLGKREVFVDREDGVARLARIAAVEPHDPPAVLDGGSGAIEEVAVEEVDAEVVFLDIKGRTGGAARLRCFVERIERLIEERTSISQDIRDVYAEAKAEGFDAAAIRKLIARREIEPAARYEADAVLATYEAAMEMGPDEVGPPLTERRPDAAAIALELLTAEIVALEDERQALALVGHVVALLDIRAEIALLRAEERERRALAKAEGFDPKQLAVTVRWFEQVAKHGQEAMRGGEATFHLYRGTVEGHAARRPPEAEDGGGLSQLLLPAPGEAPPAIGKKAKVAQDMLALARAARAAERGE